MTYLNCPQCGLSVPGRAGEDRVVEEMCPRCRGRTGALVPMYLTERPRPPVESQEVEPQAA
jgi:Zn-finger nucleic acid-binding protein